jgi:hypothetical protein
MLKRCCDQALANTTKGLNPASRQTSAFAIRSLATALTADTRPQKTLEFLSFHKLQETSRTKESNVGRPSAYSHSRLHSHQAARSGSSEAGTKESNPRGKNNKDQSCLASTHPTKRCPHDSIAWAHRLQSSVSWKP